MWTGYKLEQDLLDKEILNYIDVLVDGRYQDELHNPTLKWKGSSNQRIINVKETRIKKKVILYEKELQPC